MTVGAPGQLADFVRHSRVAAGYSQEELAERSGLSARTISDFERGLRTAPRLETIRMLAEGLGLTASERAALIAAARPELRAHLPGQDIDEAPRLGEWPAVLPRTSGELIGRERETAELVSMRSSDTCRLITLTGPGGVGKTRLALAVARELEPIVDGRVAFVALAPVRDASLVVPTIARTLGVQETGARAPFERCVDANAACLELADEIGDPAAILDGCEAVTKRLLR